MRIPTLIDGARPIRRVAPLALALALALAGCGPGGGAGHGDAGSGTTIELTPGHSDVAIDYGVTANLDFHATAHLTDGSSRDVTSEITLSIDDTRLGHFTAATLVLNGRAAGLAHVSARFEDATAAADVAVYLTRARVDPSAPANAGDLFAAATEDAALAPTVVYPQDGTLVPKNLGDFETHWNGAATTDLFEVTVASAYAVIKVYTVVSPGPGSFAKLTADEWSYLAEPRGGAFTVTIRGLHTAKPTTAGTSAPLQLAASSEDVEGGIYYWASQGTLAEGIYRHDMGRPGEPAEAFYTRDQSPDGRCIACHALSRDGERMALTFDGGDGAATVLDVKTRTALTDVGGSYAWNFASFSADHSRMITSHQGKLTLYDGDTFASLGHVPGTSYASQPELSPVGDALVYVEAPGNCHDGSHHDWCFTGGSVVVRSYDRTTDTFGAPTTLVPNPGRNVYYPSWSPDGQWLVFDESDEDAYDDASAEVYVVKADGSAPPIKIDTVNLASGECNSWVRWAPFQQNLHRAAGGDEPLFWLTFSSKRAFGVREPAGHPQVWMAPFFPDRAAAGKDPGLPAFRLPFQELGTSNHIAQWTEKVVPVD